MRWLFVSTPAAATCTSLNALSLELEKVQNLFVGPKTHWFLLPTDPASWPLDEDKLWFCTAHSLVGNTLLLLLLVYSCLSFSHFSQPLSIHLFTPLPALYFPQGWFHYIRVLMPFSFVWVFFSPRQNFPHLPHAHIVPWAEGNWGTDPFLSRSKQWFTNHTPQSSPLAGGQTTSTAKEQLPPK